MPDLSTTITTAAGDPASASVDGQSATSRPIADLILADQYLAGRVGITKKHRGIRFSKLLPAGCLSDQGGSRQGQPVNEGF